MSKILTYEDIKSDFEKKGKICMKGRVYTKLKGAIIKYDNNFYEENCGYTRIDNKESSPSSRKIWEILEDNNSNLLIDSSLVEELN